MRVTDPRIERNLPHAGAMRLLDTVIEVSSTHIVCQAPAPDAGHPLAVDGDVPAAMAAEYGAQACAVHGGLTEQDGTPREGMLAKISDTALIKAVIPRDLGTLLVSATLLGRTAAACMYSFALGCGGESIARGRIMVAFRSVMGRQ